MEMTTAQLFELVGRLHAQNELLKLENTQLRAKLSEQATSDNGVAEEVGAPSQTT